MNNKGGRPPKFESPDQLLQLAQEYFDYCEANVKLPTKQGLALWCGTNRQTFSNYEKKEGYFDAIKDIYDSIEDALSQAMMNREFATAGVIFYMKNAFNYRDKTDVDHTTKGKPLPFMTIDALRQDQSDNQDSQPGEAA